MIFFKINVDNLYQFKDFSVDLTYKRESKYSPVMQKLKDFPNIKYKKINIILGSNASGKSTFGKVLNMIQNALGGKNIFNESYKLIEYFRSSKETAKLDFIFSTKKFLYKVYLEFDDKGFKLEKYSSVSLKNTSINSLISELNSMKCIEYQNSSEVSKTILSLVSDKSLSEMASDVRHGLSYIYSYSEQHERKDHSKVDLNIYNQILTSLDSSIEKVVKSKEVKENLVIEFINGAKEIITPNSTLFEGNSILSHGTRDAIFLSYIISQMADKNYGTVYVDERMSHLHTDVERQIAEILISLSNDQDVQLFLTSHNSDLINMKLPIYNFMLFKKEKDGSIRKVVHPENHIKHQDRTIKKIIDTDIFGTAPKLSNMIQLHEILIDKVESNV